MLALLLPFVVVAFVLALPLEWYRARRAALHNSNTMQRWSALAEGRDGAYREPAERLLAVDFRIQHRARPAFLGTALFAIGQGQRGLRELTAFRGSPRDAADGTFLREHLGADLAFWEWELHDPYELTERTARPW